jgi:hypothetical protein
VPHPLLCKENHDGAGPLSRQARRGQLGIAVLMGSSGAGSALWETNVFCPRLAVMTILSFLCRLIPGSRCAGEPPVPQQATPSGMSADLGQREAKSEALREEQLKHMGGKTDARAAQAASFQAADVTSRVRPEQSAAPRTNANLGQKDANVEARSKDKSRHMEGAPAAARQKKARKRPR